MTGSSRTLVAVVFAFALIGAALAPIAIAQDGDAAGNSPVNKTEAGGEYDRSYLNENGIRVPEIHDGWRPIEGETAAAWVRYYPTGATINDSKKSDQWQYLDPSTTVKRNYVDLTVMRLGDVEDGEATLHIVYWEKATKTVTEGNTTREVPYAANQTHETVSIDLGSARGKEVRIPLKPHYDRPVEVTMWLESSPDATRWRFTHHSLKSSQASGVDTAADLAITITKTVAIGVVLLIVLYGLGRGLNRRALVGPMKGMAWWVIVLGLLQLFVVLGAWDWVSNTLVMNPEYIAFEVGLFGFLLGIESRGRETVEKAIAIRPELRPVKTTLASGQTGLSSNGLADAEFLVVEDETGRDVLVSPGIIAWLFRIMGGREYLTGTDVIRCTTEVTTGNHDRAYIVDPMSDDVVSRDSPSIGMRMPNPTPMQVTVSALGLGTVALVGWSTGFGAGSALAVVGLVAVPAFLDVKVPDAIIDPAPASFGEAWANSLVLAAEYDAAGTVEEANDAIIKKTAEQNVRQAKANENRSKTLVEETLDGDDPDDVRDVLNMKGDPEDVLAALRERKRKQDAETEVAMGDD